jgi:membrane protein required for colicin V production
VNGIDIAVVAVLLLSGVFALVRGFVYEVLAMAGWVIAGLAAVWGEPRLFPLIKPHISNAVVAQAIGGVVIFLVVLFISSFITHAIARRVRKSAVSAADRSLGFAFGVLRGLLAASLGFIIVDKLMAPDEPEILAKARSRPLLVWGAEIIQAVVPNHMADIESQAQSAIDAARNAKQASDMFQALSAPKPKQSGQGEQAPAYDEQGLQRLIDNDKGK